MFIHGDIHYKTESIDILQPGRGSSIINVNSAISNDILQLINTKYAYAIY